MATHLFQLDQPPATSSRFTATDHALVRLVSGAIRSFDAAMLHSINVLHGRVWITLEGDRADHLLGAGDVFVPSSPGRVVLEALIPATIAVDHA